MLVYSVSWKANDKELTKGKGRVKRSEFDYFFTVLCRNINDASKALEWLFPRHYEGKFSLEDGTITIKRYNLDQRGFTINYLMMDGIHHPLCLADVDKGIASFYPKFR